MVRHEIEIKHKLASVLISVTFYLFRILPGDDFSRHVLDLSQGCPGPKRRLGGFHFLASGNVLSLTILRIKVSVIQLTTSFIMTENASYKQI